MLVEFLQINGGKMSKSLNNLYTLKDLKDRGYSPLEYRMFNFSSIYRKKINFTFEAMDSAKIALKRLKDGYQRHLNGKDKVETEVIVKFKEDFLNAIIDDLNMPQAMSVVWNAIKYEKKSKKIADMLLDFDRVLGLEIGKLEQGEELPKEILELVEKREKKREEKNWKLSDNLRDEIIKLGYNIKDTKDGMEISKI